MRSALQVLLFLSLSPAILAAGPRYQLVVIDSPGQPADELAREIHGLSRHPRSRCGFLWLRVGAPSSRLVTEPATATPAPPPPLEPTWDPDGKRSSRWRLEGLPRILLIDGEDHVDLREVFLPRNTLRYLSRHPEGFSQPSSMSRMGDAPPGPRTAAAAAP